MFPIPQGCSKTFVCASRPQKPDLGLGRREIWKWAAAFFVLLLKIAPEIEMPRRGIRWESDHIFKARKTSWLLIMRGLMMLLTDDATRGPITEQSFSKCLQHFWKVISVTSSEENPPQNKLPLRIITH